MGSRLALIVLALGAICSSSAQTQSAQNYLANNTVLIIRHSEKPEVGTGLTPMGEARAQLYAKYFQPFQEEGFSIFVDCLYAGADSRAVFDRGSRLSRSAKRLACPFISK